MKKLLIVALAIIWFGWFSLASTQLDEAISRMNQKGLTKFDNATDFMATNGLRRDEASKFFVQYAKEVMWLTPDTSKTSCNFTDLSKARPDLKDLIKESCQLWLFQWYNWKFMPTQSLTNAQAITVLIRMIDWKKDETQWHFAQLYFEKAQALWIMSWLTLNSTTNFDKLTTRGDVGQLIYSTSKLSWTNIQSTNQSSNTANCNSLSCLLNFNNCPNECKENDTPSCQSWYHKTWIWTNEECVPNFQLCKIWDKRQWSSQKITAEIFNIDSGIWKKEYINGSRNECKLYCNDWFTNINWNIVDKTECFPIRTCSIENGVGSQIYYKVFYPKIEFIRSTCKATACNEWFSILQDNCISDTNVRTGSCTVTNWLWIRTMQWATDLWCEVTSCNMWYQISWNTCVQIPNTRTCEKWELWKGLMYFQNNTRTDCIIQDCAWGTLQNNECVCNGSIINWLGKISCQPYYNQ